MYAAWQSMAHLGGAPLSVTEQCDGTFDSSQVGLNMLHATVLNEHIKDVDIRRYDKEQISDFQNCKRKLVDTTRLKKKAIVET